jgi:aspartyl-tRNA(Asn)/glutamyl-tRNA(Gln) amidotransferase subunit B
LREVLVALGANDGNMEEGSLRCDANVSIRPAGTTTLGTKTEVKNVNSFRYLQKALEFEIERQIAVLEGGGAIRQETRLWDSDREETTSMRSKEEAHDYRYFPEPDLPPLDVDQAWVSRLRAALPELPEARKNRLIAVHGLGEYDANLLVRLIAGGADYFEALVAAGASAKAASNWLLGEIRRRLKELGADDMARVPVPPEALAELIGLAEQSVISSTVAKDVFDRMWTSGGRARAIVDAEGLAQIGDSSALGTLVGTVLDANPDAVAQYRAGRTNTFGFLVGQVMKASGGKANPKLTGDLLKQALRKTTD